MLVTAFKRTWDDGFEIGALIREGGGRQERYSPRNFFQWFSLEASVEVPSPEAQASGLSQPHFENLVETLGYCVIILHLIYPSWTFQLKAIFSDCHSGPKNDGVWRTMIIGHGDPTFNLFMALPAAICEFAKLLHGLSPSKTNTDYLWSWVPLLENVSSVIPSLFSFSVLSSTPFPQPLNAVSN